MDEKNGLDKLSTKILTLAILGVLIVLTVFLGIAVLRPNTSNASAQAGFIPENTKTSSAASYISISPWQLLPWLRLFLKVTLTLTVSRRGAMSRPLALGCLW